MKLFTLSTSLMLFIFFACTANAGEPPWAVSGKVLVSDNCVIGCPCIFGEQPSHNTCRFMAVFQTEDGHYG